MASDETSAPADRKDGQESAAPPVAAGAPSADIAVFNNEVEILINRRLPQFDKGPAAAYAARLMGESRADYFAIVCMNDLTPQEGAAPAYAGITNPHLIRLVSYGVVHWPPVQAQRYVLIYESALQAPLVPAGADGSLGWRSDFTMETLVRPLVALLADIRRVGLTHGCVNASNIFASGEGGLPEKIALGENLSVPPGYAQPPLYETIERAIADPAGRGPGTSGDDLYALGATLAVAQRHRNPLEGLSADGIIRQKINSGSFAALTGKERFSGAMFDLLRGLLLDDPAQRWTLDEVITWLDGQRMTSRQGVKKPRAARPLAFNGERYLRPDLIAIDLFRNPNEAIQLIEGDSLRLWVERSLDDEDAAARLDATLEAAQDTGRGPGFNERLLTRIAIALYPEAPIHYRGLKFYPEGYPFELSHAVCNRKDLTPFAEIVQHQFIPQWVNAQSEIEGDMNTLGARYDTCRAFLRQTTIGYGIERCLYFLDPDCHCMSEQLKGFYVRTPDDLLRAYEQIATRPNRPSLFIDRHIAAFLSVKERRVIDPYFGDLNAPEHFRRVLGNLKCLATIQQRGRIESLPNLSAWMAELLRPVYDRLHDRKLRDKIAEKVDKLKKGGDLAKIAALIDNAEMQQQDFAGFQQALEEYARLREEHAALEAKMSNPVSTFGNETGREIAAVFSGILATILIVIFALLYFSHHMVLPG
jgi:hypothetical protein